MEENNLAEKLQVNENIKDSIYNENQNSHLISKEESDNIKPDIQTLNNMGFGNLTEAKNINLNTISNVYIDKRTSFCSCDCWDYSETLENIEETIAYDLESSKFFSGVCILSIFYYFFSGFFINSHFIMRTITEEDYEEDHKVNENKIYSTICILTSLCLSICFQISYITLFSPFSIFLLCKMNCLLLCSFCPIHLRELIKNTG